MSIMDRIRREPVILVSLALAALQAYQQAVGDGLTGEDAFIFVAQAALTWCARELVVPAIRVKEEQLTVIEEVVEPPLPAPVGGDAP